MDRIPSSILLDPNHPDGPRISITRGERVVGEAGTVHQILRLSCQGKSKTTDISIGPGTTPIAIEEMIRNAFSR